MGVVSALGRRGLQRIEVKLCFSNAQKNITNRPSQCLKIGWFWGFFFLNGSVVEFAVWLFHRLFT